MQRLRRASMAEIGFRLRQEVFNAATFLRPPRAARGTLPAAVPGLPPVETQLEGVRGTRHAAETTLLAEEILARRIPILGHGAVDPGSPPEWRLDWVHGTVSPLDFQRRIPYLDFRAVGDHKVVWELSRHQHFVVLAQAYRLSGRMEFADELRRQWLHWIQSNPFQRGIHWTSALEVGFRALSWIWALHLCGEQLPTEPVVTSLYQHASYLEHNFSFYFSPNTHLLGEAVALHALGLVLEGQRRAERWRQLGDAVVREQLERQVLPDGAHFEQSTYYHLYALDFFLLHYVFSGKPAWMRPALRRMAAYLDAVMGPAHRLLFLGDDDGGRVFHPYGERERFGQATLATCWTLFGTPAWAADRELLAEQAAWWVGGAVAAADGSDASVAAGLFADAGLVTRAAGDWWLLMDAGPFGPGTAGHSHADALSVVVRRRDQDVFIDAGTYDYVADPGLRQAFRGSAAHNTVCVDGQDQARAAGPFAWSGRPEVTLESASANAVSAACRYEIPGGIVCHRRAVELFPERIVFTDEVDGPAGEHTCEVFWHVGTEVRTLSSCRFGIGDLAIIETSEPAQVIRGWRSRAYGNREEAPVIVARRCGTFPMRFVVTLEACR